MKAITSVIIISTVKYALKGILILNNRKAIGKPMIRNIINPVAMLLNSMIGIGLTFMPAALDGANIFITVGMMVFISIISSFTLYALLNAAKKSDISDEVSYANLCKKIHRHGHKIANVIFGIVPIFSCLVYQRFTVEIITLLLGFNNRHALYEIILKLVTFCSAIYLLPFTFTKSMNSIKYLSHLVIICTVLLIVYLSIANIFFSTLPVFYEKATKPDTNIFVIINFIGLVSSCHTNAVKIFCEMKKKRKFDYTVIAIIVPLLGFILNLTVGLLGKRLWEPIPGFTSVASILADSSSGYMKYLYNNNFTMFCYSKFQAFCQVLIIIGSFPLEFYPARRSFSKLLPVRDKEATNVRISVNLFLFFIMTLINFIPGLHFEMLFGLMSAIFVCCITFLIPSMLGIAYTSNKKSLKTIIYSIVIILSIVYAVFGTTVAISPKIFDTPTIVDVLELATSVGNSTIK